MPAPVVPPLRAGAYTLPDAARLLNLSLPRLRTWVRGVLPEHGGVEHEDGQSRRYPAGQFSTKGERADKHFDFLTLIELFSVAHLRDLGLSMKTLRACRQELADRYRTPYPFALRGLLTDGARLLKELGSGALLEIGAGGQTGFEEVIRPFCHRLDFDAISNLASRFYPVGREGGIVVDPRHSFGRPVIAGTNVTTESIASLMRAGEDAEDLAGDYRLDVKHISAAWDFELHAAA